MPPGSETGVRSFQEFCLSRHTPRRCSRIRRHGARIIDLDDSGRLPRAFARGKDRGVRRPERPSRLANLVTAPRSIQLVRGVLSRNWSSLGTNRRLTGSRRTSANSSPAPSSRSIGNWRGGQSRRGTLERYSAPLFTGSAIGGALAVKEEVPYDADRGRCSLRLCENCSPTIARYTHEKLSKVTPSLLSPKLGVARSNRARVTTTYATSTHAVDSQMTATERLWATRPGRSAAR